MTSLKHVTILFALISLIQCSLYAQINSFPYLEDFENGPGGWTTGSLVASPASSWVLGDPVGKAVFDTAYSGSNCWMTGGLTGVVGKGEKSYIESPLIDLSTVNNPVFSFHWMNHLRDSISGFNVWYSKNNGTNWDLLGGHKDINWYTRGVIESDPGTNRVISYLSIGLSPLYMPGFMIYSDTSWNFASRAIPQLAGESQVKFRIYFATIETRPGTFHDRNEEGVGIDDIEIYDRLPTSFGDTLVICPGMSVPLLAKTPQGQAATSFLWSTGETAPRIYVSTPGWYFVTTQLQGGGQLMDSVLIRVANPQQIVDTVKTPAFHLIFQDTFKFCTLPISLMSPIPASEFSAVIYPDGTSSLRSNDMIADTGWYVLQQTDFNTCILADSFYIAEKDMPLFDLGPDINSCSPIQVNTPLLPNRSTQANIFNSSVGFFDSLTMSNQFLTPGVPFLVSQSGYIHYYYSDFQLCDRRDTIFIHIGALNAQVATSPDFGLNDGIAWLDQSARLAGTGPLQFDWDSSGVYTSNDTLQNLAAGTYHVRILDANGCTDTVSYTIQSGTAVMPGDTDFDQDVDMADLLPIGLHYNAVGPARQNAVIAWLPQACLPWTGSQANGQSLCHVDTDGSGLINDDDTLAIMLNFGSTHGYSKTASGGIRLHFQMPTTGNAGDTLRIPLLIADMDTPATNVRGISFSIQYDTALVVANTAYMDFSSSWLGTKGLNMLSLQRDDFSNGKIDIGMVRTDTTQQSGYGRLADIVIVTDDHIGKRDVPFRLTIENIYAVDNDGDEIDFVGEPGVMGIATSIADPISESITIFPNPNKGIFTLNHPEVREGSIRIFTIQGSLVGAYDLNPQGATSLDAGKVPAGLYYVLVENKDGKWTRKVVIE